MKIKLSEDEVYEIKMPEEIGMQEFQGMVAKFNFLLKNFTKFDIGGEIISQEADNSNNEKSPYLVRKQDRIKWKFLGDNRAAFVEILQAHYSGDKYKFLNSIRKYGLKIDKVDMAATKCKTLREAHKIKPQEVGLKDFPTRKVTVDQLRLNN